MRTTLGIMLVCSLALAGCIDTLRPAASLEQAAPNGGLPIHAYRVVDDAREMIHVDPASSWTTLHPLGVQTFEPSIAVANDGAIFVIANEEVLRSRDQGATWEVVHSYAYETLRLPNGGVLPVPPSLDPWIWADAVTGRVFASHLTFACTSLSWSDDAGDSWSPWWYAACAAPSVDFQKIVTGPPGPEPNEKAGAAHPSVAYMCYNKIIGALGLGVAAGHYGLACAVSYDGGMVWENEQILSSNIRVGDQTVRDGCPGGAWHPAVSPDGVVAVRAQAFGGRGCLFVTHDSGATWVDMGPGSELDGAFLSYDDAGTLYAMSMMHEGPIRISSSPDHGQTWTTPVTVMPPGVHGPLMPAMVAGAEGRLFISFLGTDDPDADGDITASDDTRWHAWLLGIEDADTPTPTVRAHRATPDDAPVYIGPGRPDARGGLHLGDFVTAARAPDGTAYAVFPQTCNDGCQGNPDATRADQDKLGTVIALRGWSLAG